MTFNLLSSINTASHAVSKIANIGIINIKLHLFVLTTLEIFKEHDVPHQMPDCSYKPAPEEA